MITLQFNPQDRIINKANIGNKRINQNPSIKPFESLKQDTFEKKSTISFKGGTSYDDEYKSLRKKRSGLARLVGAGKKSDRARALGRVERAAISYEDKNESDFKIYTDLVKKMEDSSNKDKKTISSLESEIEDLKKQKEDLKNNSVKQEEFEKVKEQLEKTTKEVIDIKNSKKTNEDAISRMKETAERTNAVKEKTGWGKIAGSDNIKQELKETFMNNLIVEQGNEKADFPNAYLFYGPKGTGKTTFATAFAEQSGCEFKEIEMLQKNNEIIDELLEAGEDSKKLYSDEKKRTIILIDEFDAIAKDPKKDATETDINNLNTLKKFIKNCSERFKCTLFVTTNKPLNISNSLIDDDFIEDAIFLGPPDKKDTAAILKHYAKEHTTQDINYDELAEEAHNIAEQSGDAFSPSRLEDTIKECSKGYKKTGQPITQKNISDKLAELKADIPKSAMEEFTNVIKHLT